MNEVKQKLLNIVEPAADNRSVSTLTGTVLSINEKANTCDVRYTRSDGIEINKHDVPIMLTNKCIIDWFPEENDTVLIQEKINTVFIVGPAYSSYGNIRNSISLKNDIFSESFTDVLGGFLF